MDENCLVRKVLLNCAQPTKESLYRGIPDLDVEKAIEIARDREKWKKERKYLLGSELNFDHSMEIHISFRKYSTGNKMCREE